MRWKVQILRVGVEGKRYNNTFSLLIVFSLKYSTRYKIMNCLIQKSLSTINQGIMCFLYDEENAKKNNAKDKPLGEIAK